MNQFTGKGKQQLRQHKQQQEQQQQQKQPQQRKRIARRRAIWRRFNISREESGKENTKIRRNKGDKITTNKRGQNKTKHKTIGIKVEQRNTTNESCGHKVIRVI